MDKCVQREPPVDGVGVQLRIEFSKIVWDEIERVAEVLETYFPQMVIELLLATVIEVLELPEDNFDVETISFECDFVKKY